jgi:hypothetical protein
MKFIYCKKCLTMTGHKGLSEMCLYCRTERKQTKTNTMKLRRHKQNLKIEGSKVISYVTHVANIKGDELEVLGYWSATTSRHISYVAQELNLTIRRNGTTNKN